MMRRQLTCSGGWAPCDGPARLYAAGARCTAHRPTSGKLVRENGAQAAAVPARTPQLDLVACGYDELPRGAQVVLRTAVAAGWVVCAYVCRGWTLHSNRSPSRLVTQHMLRLARGRRRLVAWWWDGKSVGGVSWGETPLRSVKLSGMEI